MLRLNRRTLLPGLAGISAAVGGLFSKFGSSGSGDGLIAAAHAEGALGVRAKQGKLAHISGSAAPVTQMAEWSETGARNSITASKAAIDKAPATASRYDSKSYNFPCGGVRVLTFKKGSPVFHQVTFETSIYVLEGSATVKPLYGLAGKPVKISAGDALYLPTGVISETKAASDVVLVLFVVANPKPGAKQSIVTSKQAKANEIAQWQDGGKELSARTPEELRAAPKNASRYVTKRYEFDGNSFRVATLKKGTRTNNVAPTRSDVLMYVAKGSARRTEGAETFQISAGDAFRERKGSAGSWEASDDLVLIATDAPPNFTEEGTGWTNTLAKAATTGSTLFEFGIDHNQRSTVGVISVPMQTVSNLEQISAKQDATFFRIGYRQFLPHSRTAPDYASAAGPTEMHVGGDPHFVARMAGSTENTLQDGSVFRQSAGDFVFCRPGSLHHSNQVGFVPGLVINMYTPGTEATTAPMVVK